VKLSNYFISMVMEWVNKKELTREIKSFLEKAVLLRPVLKNSDLEVTYPFVDEKGVFLPPIEDLLDVIKPISHFNFLIQYRNFIRFNFELEDFIGEEALYNYVDFKTFSSQGNSQFYRVNGTQIFNKEPDGSHLYWHFNSPLEFIRDGNKIYLK
jgi:hypothetical protein